jgi:hypothetical protein
MAKQKTVAECQELGGNLPVRSVYVGNKGPPHRPESAMASPLLASVLLLLGSLLRGPEPLPHPEGPRQETSWERHEVDVAASDVYVVTDKSGLLSFLGHEHAIIPMDWSGEICVPSPMEPEAWGSILIRTSSLVIDSDSARGLADLGDGPGEDDVEEIQKKLLDPSNLAAEAHAEIRLESTAEGVGQGEGQIRLRTRLTVKGQTREFEHPATIGGAEGGQAPGGALRIRGTLEIRQTAFGIEPASVAGVVNVEDEVELHFDLVTTPTGSACTPPPREPEGGL